MTDQWDERRRPRADEAREDWAGAPGRESPDDPEFRGYRPNFEGGERFTGPPRGDPRDQSPDDPEFERTYRPNFGRGRQERRAFDPGPYWPGGRHAPRDDDDEWRRPGRFTGYGPRGYQRSDDRIREDICERLTYYGELDAREIEIDVRSGEVTLTGTVDDRAAKRAAERIAETVSGVHDVHNELQLRSHTFQRQAR